MSVDTNKNLPNLSKDLVEELDRLFPEKSATLDFDTKELYFKGGQRSVVRYLKEQFDRQNETILKGE
jgi:hypothetical protein